MVADPALEQVTETGAAGLEQLHRIAALGLLGQHHDAGSGQLLPDAVRRLDALGAEPRRHADVGQHGVRLQPAYCIQQLDGVAHRGDDVDFAGRLDQLPGAFADEIAVLGEDHPQWLRHGLPPAVQSSRCAPAAPRAVGYRRQERTGSPAARRGPAAGRTAPAARTTTPVRARTPGLIDHLDPQLGRLPGHGDEGAVDLRVPDHVASACATASSVPAVNSNRPHRCLGR